MTFVPAMSVDTLYCAQGLTVMCAENGNTVVAFGSSMYKLSPVIVMPPEAIISAPAASVDGTQRAYNVMFSVTVSEEKFHCVSCAASRYQPTNMYPSRVGAFGRVSKLPYLTTAADTALPPMESNTTLKSR